MSRRFQLRCGHQRPVCRGGDAQSLPVRNPTSLAAALRTTKRYDNTKERTAVWSAFRPYLPLLSLDDGAADRQSHVHPVLLRCEEWFEYLLELVSWNA